MCNLVDDLVYRTAYLHAYYALKEAKEVAQKRGVWNEELECWLQKMGNGYFYSSAGILVGKSEHRLDGHTTYFRYDKDGNCVGIVEYLSIYEYADEDCECEVFSRVDFLVTNVIWQNAANCSNSIYDYMLFAMIMILTIQISLQRLKKSFLRLSRKLTNS